MNAISRRYLVGWAAWSLVCTSAIVLASKPGPASPFAVDVVSLKSGKALRGAVVQVNEQGVVMMVVARDWLQHNAPDLSQKADAKEQGLSKQAAEQLRDRVKKWMENAANTPRLVFFLKQELERTEKTLSRDLPVAASRFQWIELEPELVARMVRVPADRHRLALWSWSEQLPNVETRTAQELERDLKKRKIDLSNPAPDLSAHLPPRLQDDREWAARMAIVEYTLSQSLDFQGTGDFLVRVDSDRTAIDLAPVLTKVLQSQVQSLLNDLAGDRRDTTAATGIDALKSATREADQASARGLRATRVDVQVDGSRATVQTSFAARMPNGKWDVVWSHRESQDATRPRADLEGRIAEDPQIKQVLTTVKSLGLNAGPQLQQAIRFGAATMAAQEAADSSFFEFRDRCVKHLDGPPLLWKN